MRTIPALTVSAVLLATLTACTGGPFGATCAPLVSSGPASALVSAEGAIGNQPKVNFPTPIVSADVEADSVIVGDGEHVRGGETVVIKYSLYNGRTGAGLGSSGYAHAGDYVTLGATSSNSVVSDGLECATVGSRVAIVASGMAVHGGQGDPAQDLRADDSIVYVIDVIDVMPAKANGAPQISQAGLPAVVTAPNGAPGITIPRAAPPTELTVATLKLGNGEVLTADHRVLVKFTSVAWETGRVLDSTWANGRGSIIPLTAASGLPPGVAEALIGHTLNSQVLVVVPKGEGSDSTLVYVIDILGIIQSDY